jgi:hypothetical protein
LLLVCYGGFRSASASVEVAEYGYPHLLFLLHPLPRIFSFATVLNEFCIAGPALEHPSSESSEMRRLLMFNELAMLLWDGWPHFLPSLVP